MSGQGTLGEFDLVAELLAPLADNPTAQNLRDDAAAFTPPAGHDIVISTDALVSGVHFPIDADAALIARRALACNLSDLAAKGATLKGCLLNLGVGPDWDDAFLRAFVSRFGDGLTAANMQLWGGDTVRTPTPFISLTVHGLVKSGQMLTRGGAQDGDDVYVTGTIGDGWLDLESRGAAYADPRPPLAFGRNLVGLAHAALDISDGLMADLTHMARDSGGTISVTAHSVPLSAQGRIHLASGDFKERIAALVSGGDDLQIAFCAPRSAQQALIDMAAQTSTALTPIGTFTRSDAPHRAVLLDDSGAEIALQRLGYSHF